MSDAERNKYHQMLGRMYARCNGDKTGRSIRELVEEFERDWEIDLAKAQEQT